VLVGSQNWSTTSVSSNRENQSSGQTETARYFAGNFLEADWGNERFRRGEGESPTERRLFTS